MKYIKDESRITVIIYDSNTDEEILKIKNKNWMTIGDVFTSHYISELLNHELGLLKKEPPKNILVMVAEEFTLEN